MKTEHVDLVVIGSGAGGAVVAHEAVLRGKSTLIVERGPYVRASDMTHRDFEMIPRLYKDGGIQTTTTMDMFIIQGSCVGGSTVLANNVLFRAPDEELDQWQRLGANIDRKELVRSYEHVERTLGAAPANHANMSNGSRRLYDGAREIGLEPEWMTTALGDCIGCGGCNIGCAFDYKPSALSTFIRWAEAKGARVLADTNVERIEHKRGRVTGLFATTGKDKTPLKIYAKQVVVAAGAIGSSGLLLKSKINKNVGTRVSFNTGAALVADFPEPIDAYDGDQMSCYVKGDGFTIEPVFNPPATTAVMLPGWFADHGNLMRRYRHLAFAGALVGTQSVGRVVQSPFFGHEETIFRLPFGDLIKLRRGLKELARIWLAAGAKRVVLPTHVFQTIERVDEIDKLDVALADTRRFGTGSSHPQGGNPLSDDPEIGVVDRDFAVHGFENLFVCDASVFTSCIRVNPIDTIMALAHYASPRIMARG